MAGGENLGRVARALERFGLTGALVSAAGTLGANEVLSFGVPPTRVDLLRTLSGVSFDERAGARCGCRWAARRTCR